MVKMMCVILGLVFLALGILGLTGVISMFTSDPAYVNIGEIVLGGIGLLVGIYARQGSRRDLQIKENGQQKKENDQMKKQNDQQRQENYDQQKKQNDQQRQENYNQQKKQNDQQRQENDRLRKVKI